MPVIKDISLIIEPDSTWDGIKSARHGAGFIFVFYLLPTLLLVALVEGYGLVLRGRHEVATGMLVNHFTLERVAAFETAQWTLMLVLMLVGGLCITLFGNACHNRNRIGQSLALLFHAVGPFLLIQLLNIIPGIYCWLTWLVGMAFMLGTLYHGLPRLLMPDPPSAMGLFLMSAFVLLLLMFCVRLLTYLYLNGDINGLT